MAIHRICDVGKLCLTFIFLVHFAPYNAASDNGASFTSAGTEKDVMQDERYQRGKAHFEALQAEAKMPKYSKCWTDALQTLVAGCKHLNDDIQHRLALGFTNCFLLKTGRRAYPCENGMDIAECVQPMASEAYNSYTEFFTHSQHICFFLQAQVWQAGTQKTIGRLTENSAQVAQQIEESGMLQQEILKRQNDSLINQDLLLARGNELKGALEDSSVDVQLLMKEFKDATAEQRASIMDVFDRIQSLQSMVMGEFTGFYSMVFYTTSLIVSYLLTSTPRTCGARFWLFILMTLNVVAERLLVSYGAIDFITDSGQVVSSSEIVYGRLSVCRKVSCVFGIFVLLLIALMYEDINKVNHQLLQTITEQNQQIKHLLQSSAVNPVNEPKGSLNVGLRQNGKPGYEPISDQVDSAIGYESDSEYDASSFGSRTTDHTYKVGSDSEAESFLTTTSVRLSRTTTPSLLDELRHLREQTPVHGVTDVPTEYSTGIFDACSVGAGDARTSTPQKRRGRPPGRQTPLNISEVPSPQTRYNLRARQGTPPVNPVLQSETEKDFYQQVEHLAQVSSRNSRKTKYTLQRLRQNQRLGDSYSTDEC